MGATLQSIPSPVGRLLSWGVALLGFSCACGETHASPAGSAGSSAGGALASAGTGGSGGAVAIGGASGGEVGAAGKASDAGAALSLHASRIALGAEYGCAIDSAGAIECWGTSEAGLGQTTPPAGTFKAIAALSDIECGIKADASVVCWGNLPGAAASPVPAGLSASAIAVGVAYQCVVTSDMARLTCWGATDVVQGLPPSGPFLQVSVGRNFACALEQDGTLACWGNNAFGEATPPVGTFTQLVTSNFHSCALKADGTAACWGLGNATMAPDGGNQFDPFPADGDDADAAWGQAVAPTDQRFTRLAVGFDHSCGILESGDVLCWGAGKTAGNCAASIDDCGQSVAQTGPFVDIALGLSNSCGILATGKLKCWGSDTAGRSTPPPSFQ